MQYARVLIDNRAAIRRKAVESLGEPLTAATEVTEAQAKSLVPVRTGFLYSTLTGQPTGFLRFSVTALAAYAGYVEMGSNGRPARPYLVPALLFAGSVLPSLLRRSFGARFTR